MEPSKPCWSISAFAAAMVSLLWAMSYTASGPIACLVSGERRGSVRTRPPKVRVLWSGVLGVLCLMRGCWGARCSDLIPARDAFRLSPV